MDLDGQTWAQMTKHITYTHSHRPLSFQHQTIPIQSQRTLSSLPHLFISAPSWIFDLRFLISVILSLSRAWEKKQEKDCTHLIVSVAVVCLLWFQIPQHHDARLKSYYELGEVWGATDRENEREKEVVTQLGSDLHKNYRLQIRKQQGLKGFYGSEPFQERELWVTL